MFGRRLRGCRRAGGLAALKAGISKLFGKEVGREISKSEQRAIRSFEKRIAEHRAKLEEFRKNPTVKEEMKGMSGEAIKKQQKRRMELLEKEIEKFKKEIEKIKNPPPPDQLK
jgi:hypothetical protein